MKYWFSNLILVLGVVVIVTGLAVSIIFHNERTTGILCGMGAIMMILGMTGRMIDCTEGGLECKVDERTTDIKLALTGWRNLLFRFHIWISGYLVGALAFTAGGYDIYLCKQSKVWNNDNLEVNDFAIFLDVLEHEIIHTVIDGFTDENSKLKEIKSWNKVQKGFDRIFNLENKNWCVPRNVFGEM